MSLPPDTPTQPPPRPESRGHGFLRDREPAPPPAKKHARVTPEGRFIGLASARLAERGLAILRAQGLAGLDHPSFRADMCPSCACRNGTVPNGCLQTQLDLLKSVIDGKGFLCHAPADGRLCAGWMRARAAHAKNPLPQFIQRMLADWEYSPPDEIAEPKGGAA